jgi:hypothetical protein
MERLGADEELLSIIGSWHDSLDDADILSLLREYRVGRVLLHRPAINAVDSGCIPRTCP